MKYRERQQVTDILKWSVKVVFSIINQSFDFCFGPNFWWVCSPEFWGGGSLGADGVPVKGGLSELRTGLWTSKMGSFGAAKSQNQGSFLAFWLKIAWNMRNEQFWSLLELKLSKSRVFRSFILVKYRGSFGAAKPKKGGLSGGAYPYGHLCWVPPPPGPVHSVFYPYEKSFRTVHAQITDSDAINQSAVGKSLTQWRHRCIFIDKIQNLSKTRVFNCKYLIFVYELCVWMSMSISVSVIDIL